MFEIFWDSSLIRKVSPKIVVRSPTYSGQEACGYTWDLLQSVGCHISESVVPADLSCAFRELQVMQPPALQQDLFLDEDHSC